MASNFQIFCDDDIQQTATVKDAGLQQQQQQQIAALNTNKHQLLQQPSHQLKERQLANGKREPLAVKKLVSLKLQPQLQQQQHSLNHQPSHVATGHPLGQLPQGSHVSSDDENQENDVSMVSLGSDFEPSVIYNQSRHHELTDLDDENYFNDDSIRFEENFQADEELIDDYDEELLMELDSAFEQHDSSVAYKNIDYVADIMSYLSELERQPEVRAHPDYMNAQKDLGSSKRKVLIDWMVEVASEFKMQPDTLFLSINLIDRFLSKIAISLNDFQLLGVAAMFIASKYEEIYPPELHQFVDITDDTFSGKQIRLMELEVLKTLDFRLSLPTSVYYIREILTFNKFTKQVYHLAEYLCHLALLEDKPFLEYYPSEIAYAAVILAVHELNAASKISQELKHAFDKSNIDQLNRISGLDHPVPLCIESLLNVQTNATAYQATYEKFLSDHYESVALIKPCIDLTQVIA